MKYRIEENEKGQEIVMEGSFTFRDHDTFFEIISRCFSNPSRAWLFPQSAESCWGKRAQPLAHHRCRQPDRYCERSARS